MNLGNVTVSQDYGNLPRNSGSQTVRIFRERLVFREKVRDYFIYAMPQINTFTH